MKNILLRVLLFLIATTASFDALVAQQMRPLQSGDKAGAHQKVRENTNIGRLKVLAQQYDEEHKAEMQRALEIARRDSLPLWFMDKNGKIFVLSGLDDSGQLEYTVTDNLDAAATTSTDAVWDGGAAGLSLSGAGLGLGLWEAGGIPLANHQELAGRVFIASGQSSTVSEHATHVCGTLIAEGVDEAARGMANEAAVLAFDSSNDLAEMASEAADGMLLSNHSYSTLTGWYFNSNDDEWYWYGNTSVSTVEDFKFGLYNSQARQWDEVAFNAPYYLPVKSAGNDRNDDHSGGHNVMQNNQWVFSSAYRDPDGGADGYDCISTYSTAKNILTVGAIEDIPGGYGSPDDVEMSTFSGWGPTDDGRIKPDLVGNGVGLYSSVNGGPDEYGSLSGTSMATPNVAGSLLLLQEHCYNTFGGFLRAATLKALAIHTADEAGDDPGPDYRHGWGVLNTRKAADLITTAANAGEAGIFEDVLNNNGSLSLDITSDGTKPLRATIVWTDVPGTANGNVLNSTQRKLVNDLDLRATSAGTTFYPYTLNPASPGAPASNTQDNNRDNVEQIYIANPTAGTYTFTVSHKGTLNGGSQAFSLIFSADEENTGGGACSGNTALTSCSGTVSDGSGASDYANDLNCSWTIAPPGASSVTLTFTAFETEDNYDFVRVYDGPDASGDLLGEFSGDALPPALTASSGEMYIEFETDFSFTYDGWSANYTCSTGPANTCNQATDISCGMTVSGSTSGGAQTVPDCVTALNTAPGRWYRFTAAQSGPVTVTTCNPGTGYDTKVGVFSGSCANLVCVGGDDDDDNCGVYNRASTVQFDAAAGQTYFIYVTGFSDYSGNYQLTVSCGSGCPVPTGLAADASGYAYVHLIWDESNGATGYQTRQRVSGGAWVDGNVFTSPGVYWGNLVPNSQYEFQVRAQCAANTFSDWSAPVFVTTGGAGDPYCYSYGLTWDDWIAGVSFSNLNNNSGKNYGYGSYTNLTANVQKGNSYNITLTPATDDNAETVYWRVWIDFNKDNDFNDTGEQVFQASGANSAPVNGTVAIPTTVGTGATRMRVSMNLGSYAAPCQINDYREVEDYTVQISDGAQAPVANFSVSATCGQAPLTVSFSDMSTNSPTAWSWNFGNGQTSTQQNPGATFTQPGIYTVTLSASNAGGTDVEEKTAFITVVAPVSISASPGNEACIGSAVLLQASGASQYTWSGSGLNSTTGASVSAQPATAGMYTYTVTGSTNNCAANPVNISLTFQPIPAVNVTASSNAACTGEIVSLTATGASTYTWTGVGLSSNTGSAVTAQPAVPGSYTYQVVGTANGCNSAPQPVTVQFNSIPAVNVSASTGSACLGQAVTLTASGASTYTWSGVGLSSNTGNTVTAQPTLPGSYAYQVVGTANGCNSAPQAVNVQFNSIPAVNVSASVASACLGESVTLTASGASTYTWSGVGLSSNTGSTVTAQPAVAGSYAYQVVGAANGCNSAPQSVNVQFNSIPAVNVSASAPSVCLGEPVILTASGAASYQWSGNGLSSMTGNSVTATPPTPGTHVYTVTGTTGGCSAAPQAIPLQVSAVDTHSVHVTVEGCPGPGLTFSASVVNGGAISNILWYHNGTAVWSGPTYTLFSAANGDKVYCESTPATLPPCTQPAKAVSSDFVVDCIPLNAGEVTEGLRSVLLMPNPNDGHFRLQLESPRLLKGNIHIFNALGQLLLTNEVELIPGVNTLPLHLPSPQAGLYWLTIQAEGRSHRVGFEVH
ncbi:MAG: hypothetical protein EPGJADBJ_01641 [Saprospiraceae bacterium]|nr:hypothetical protein [Saprospiraceae bacterium]